MGEYKAREHHDRHLEPPLELPDGTVWRIRYPKFKDIDAQYQRAQGRLDALKAEAETARQEAEQRGEDGDRAGREVINQYPGDPEDLTIPYLTAERLALFIVPEVTAREVLERIGNELDLAVLFECWERVSQEISGEAAKKRMRGR